LDRGKMSGVLEHWAKIRRAPCTNMEKKQKRDLKHRKIQSTLSGERKTGGEKKKTAAKKVGTRLVVWQEPRPVKLSTGKYPKKNGAHRPKEKKKEKDKAPGKKTILKRESMENGHIPCKGIHKKWEKNKPNGGDAGHGRPQKSTRPQKTRWEVCRLSIMEKKKGQKTGPYERKKHAKVLTA